MEAQALRDVYGLSEAQVSEVEAVISLVTRAVVDGHISQHMGDWIVLQLARECAEGTLARLRG